ncbi:UDP-N-acetylmuramate dehydrogenase [Natranaerovirga hydrolytica]|uniref:UDP-N-acetylenolpyruvoylglucosamine reductase n=1 Tax=Natranaerovirga hydrolytica TaxID=680378 RepID=A0A4R1MU24_9FIRM|nr:UDP-N-acetylmuramate dehydrogenase [Natranaerovirga hydrolytica]TCK93483.1 UDP-N-acetylmuramate dehydrogenase [Natranaerovirga hydrolytica]
MNNKALYKELVTLLDKEDILLNEPMRNHTSFKIGGPVDFFLLPRNPEELAQVITLCKKESVPYCIIGNGSNLLVKDEGFRGVIIQVYKNLSQVTIEDTTVKAQAGILLSTLSKKICKAGLKGFEFASGIPGTLGGAVCMNAGAYGGEISHVIVSATVIDHDGNLISLDKEQLELGYRTSIIQKNNLIVVNAQLELVKGDVEEIQDIIKDLNNRRKEKQPLELPSAGSTFKRPTGYYAGKLIMDAGLRGYRIGDAQISQKHCGFIVNVGKASAEDVIKLIQYVQKEVKDKFQVDLETEVRIIG